MEKSSDKTFDPFYRMRVYDRHHIQKFIKGCEKIEQRDEKEIWMRFTWLFDIHYNVINSFGEYILFEDKEDTGKRCTKVCFADGTYVYAAYSLDAFEQWMEKSYIPVYTEWSERMYELNNK